MIARLYSYFGVLGVTSIVAWAAAFVVVALCARHRRRQYCYLGVVGLAMVALLLARENRVRVRAFEIDRREETALLQRAEADARPTIRFAEDESVNRFRPEGAKARLLPEAQVEEANRWARLNVLAARLTFWLAVLLVLGDYLARFNRLSECYLPVPIAGHWLDALVPIPARVSVPRAELQATLATIVRRGETFVYFGQPDPCAGASLERLPGWSLPKLVATGEYEAEFVFDAVWFNRYFVIITDPSWVESLRQYLVARRVTRAAARKTVRLIWDFAGPLDAELLALCRDANFHIVLVK